MGGDRRIGVFWAWGRGGRRIGVSAYSGWISAYRRILGLGVGGGRGVGVSAYRRIIVFGAASGASAYRRILGLGGGGGGDRRIGVLSFLGQRAAHRRIGVFWPGGRGGWGGIGVSAGVSACWSGTSAYRRILGLEGDQGRDRRIGVFWT